MLIFAETAEMRKRALPTHDQSSNRKRHARCKA